ncbi:MAG TPA: entericidin A/B family lipoprotein [Burkholderiales bacterium]|jgi:predicted small secreted protein|nr:entericidin A/B family lipoprotein [Burkholderiales bacterium]
MSRILAVIAALLAVTALAACNTVQGMGKDVSAAGHKIEKSAQ